MTTLKTIQANLRRLRLARKLTQEQLADRAGIAYKYLQKIETGTVNLQLETLEKLAKALKVEVVDLFRHT